MKRYKLLKDMPTIKAGTVFVLNGIYVTQADCDTKINIEDMHNFDEWFEEMKEFKELRVVKELKEFEKWTPKYDDVYKFMNTVGEVYEDVYFNGKRDKCRLSIGNCYPLDTPDELIIKEQKLIPQAMNNLKMAAKKAWFEFDGSDGPDWSDCGQHKYYVYYNWSVSNKGFHVVDTDSANVFGCIYFPTEESAQAIIDTMKDDLKLIFGVK